MWELDNDVSRELVCQSIVDAVILNGRTCVAQRQKESRIKCRKALVLRRRASCHICVLPSNVCSANVSIDSLAPIHPRGQMDQDDQPSAGEDLLVQLHTGSSAQEGTR